jgi:hypothetical protein
MSEQLAIEAPEPSTRGRSAADLTADLRLRLRARYGEARRYAVLEEVANGTGSRASRICDLLTINLWPSDGLEWQGHEIKASRGDWLREIKDPDKADAFAAYCDRWWIVAADRSMVQTGELREGWGLLVPSGDGLRVVIGAAKREPKEVSRSLIAAILRRSLESSPGEHERLALQHEMQRKISEATHKSRWTERDKASLQAELDSLRKGLADFEAASGLKVEGYTGRYLGEQVARLAAMEMIPRQLHDFEHLARRAGMLAEVAVAAHEAAKAFVPKGTP